MSDLMLKKEIRKVLRSSGLEISSKMVCPIVKIMDMKYKNLDKKRIAHMADVVINEVI